MKTTVFFRMMLSVIFGVMSMSMGAQNLAAWALPDNGSTQPTEAIASFVNDNVEVTPLIRGNGFLSNATANYSFGGNSADQSTLTDAIADGDYFTMTIKAKPGYKMSITGIPAWRTGATGFNNANPPSSTNFCEVYVQYKLNDGEFADAGSVAVIATNGTGITSLAAFSEEAQTALSNLTNATTVTLRFVVVTSQARTFYVIRGDNATTERFVIGGTVIENIATVAQWNNYAPIAPDDNIKILSATDGIAANKNIATLERDAAGSNFSVSESGNYAGFATSGNWAEGRYWETTFNTVGYDNLTVTSRQRSTGRGPRDFILQYRVGEGAWNNVENGIVPAVSTSNITTGVLTVSLPSEMSNQEKVSLRWTVNSTFSANGVEDNITTAISTTNTIDITISGKIAPPALKEMTVKWNQAAINQADKTITATINSQANGFGNPDKSAVETYVTVSDDETTVTINGTTLDTALLPDQTGNFVDYSGGLTDIPVVLTNSTGTVTYYLTITDDTSTDINTIDTGEISARYYSVTGIEVPASTKGILIKRAVLGNGKIKTSKLFNK